MFHVSSFKFHVLSFMFQGGWERLGMNGCKTSPHFPVGGADEFCHFEVLPRCEPTFARIIGHHIADIGAIVFAIGVLGGIDVPTIAVHVQVSLVGWVIVVGRGIADKIARCQAVVSIDQCPFPRKCATIQNSGLFHG
jgi:hypothetical protein